MSQLDLKDGKFPNEDEIFDLDSRFYYWHPIERINDITPWIEKSPEVHYSNLNTRKINLVDVLEKLRIKGYHLFVADISLPEIKPYGFEVLKVLIPELHPLYLDEHAKVLYSIHYGEINNNPRLKPHPLT